MSDASFGRRDVLTQIRRARAIANGTSVENIADALSVYADALERRWRDALIGSENIDCGDGKPYRASEVMPAVHVKEPKSMYVAAKRDVVREMMRARRLAAGLSDAAAVRALEEYAVELEIQWRRQQAQWNSSTRLSADIA